MLLYEDDNWFAVHKPVNLSTHGAHRGDIGALEWLALHLEKNLHICSRLDKGTSGVLLFAKHAEASARAQEIHEKRTSTKTYHFISRKQLHEKHKEWQNKTPLDSKECQTSFRLLAKGNDHYLYEARITRGRMHQIRRHAAISGVPILGDEQYGKHTFPRLCLHCVELDWPDISGEIQAQTPDSFAMLLQGEAELFVQTAIAWERRLSWLPQITNSFRLIHRGEISLPVSIDVYESVLSITAFSNENNSAALKKQLRPVLDYLQQKIGWKSAHIRRHSQNPHQKKLIHDILSWGDKIPEQNMAREHNLGYIVNINGTQHPGLFLDQRDSRRRVAAHAEHKRVANLFSFTCSFSAAALESGAEVVFSVDLAGSTLNRGKENLAINELDTDGRGKFIKEDVSKWLARQIRKKEQNPAIFPYWDLVICDPPVFASAGKGRGFHVEKQWPELVRQIRKILSPQGIALFANNHRGGSSSYYKKELLKHFSTVDQLSPPMDFPRLGREPEHVRIYWCKV